MNSYSFKLRIRNREDVLVNCTPCLGWTSNEYERQKNLSMEVSSDTFLVSGLWVFRSKIVNTTYYNTTFWEEQTIKQQIKQIKKWESMI